MKLFTCAVLFSSIIFTGCAIQNVPNKRPMQQAYLEKINSPITVSTPEGQEGIATTFAAQDSSAAGAQYGLIGALTTAVIDSIANATPASIAQDGANLIATKIQQPILEQHLVDALKSQQLAVHKVQIDLGKLNKVDLVKTKNAPVEGLLIDSTYAFNQTAEFLLVTSTVKLNIAGISYQTPYKFEKKIPKHQLTGPIYFNTFNYYSQVIPQNSKSPEEISQAVSAIQEKYRNSSGSLPKKGSKSELKMRKELKIAKADFSAKEKFDFTLNEWLKDDAQLLKAEIKAANQFIAQQLVQDLHFLETPSIDGTNSIIQTDADGRVTTRIGSGILAGTIESTPKTGITDIQRNSFGWGRVYVYAKDEAAEKAKKEKMKAKRKSKKTKTRK